MSNQSPATNPTSLRKKSLLASRLSDPRSGLQLSEDRVPAKERLSIQTQRIIRDELGVSPPDLGYLQDANFQHCDDTFQAPALQIITRPSSSNVLLAGRLGPCERSPIRTLNSTEDDSLNEDRQQLRLNKLDKAAEKKKRRYSHSPVDVKNLTISPEPPVESSTNGSITIVGDTSIEISDGAIINLIVAPKRSDRRNYSLCDLVACPVAPGPIEFTLPNVFTKEELDVSQTNSTIAAFQIDKF
ncbi:hypothetical protein Bca52824_018884 [Brassica carinata]|uniref:Uncharacterized protein n=1 Tax=Brassica carinata TaxID=52824 RepID=A0A8X8AZW0_BRACI|nr:hypothetical protein Bca52824_018884 [Brassica carinata]